MTKHVTHWIGGKPWDGEAGRHGDIYDPATGQVSGQVDFAAPAEVDAAVAAAKDALLHWRRISLAKRAEEVFTPDRLEPLVLDLTSPALQALQKIRDEAHRFAVTYHKKLRSRRTISSVLDQIPGVGPALRTSLLKTLGSAKAVREASVGQLAAVPKVSPRLAERIHDFFHPALQEKEPAGTEPG